MAGAGGPPTGVTDEDESLAAETEIHHGNQFLKILRHGSWYFAASVLTKLAGLVLVPIYTDYLSPSEYGVLGTLDAVSRLLPLFISLYLDASFIRFYYTERRTSAEGVRRLYSTQFWFVVFWGSGVCLVGLVLAPTLIQPLVDTPFLPYMPLVFAAPLFTQLGIMGSQVMRADLHAREVSVINLGSFVATAAVSLTLLIGFGYGVTSLLWGLTAGPFFSFVVFTVIAVRRRLLVWTFDWSTLRRSLLFSLPLMPNLAGGWINGFSNRIMLASYGTLSEVGLFTISAQSAYVMYFLTDAVTQVQDPIGMSALTDDPEAGKRQIAEFFSVFSWSVLAAFLAVTLFSKEVVSLITAPGLPLRLRARGRVRLRLRGGRGLQSVHGGADLPPPAVGHRRGRGRVSRPEHHPDVSARSQLRPDGRGVVLSRQHADIHALDRLVVPAHRPGAAQLARTDAGNSGRGPCDRRLSGARQSQPRGPGGGAGQGSATRSLRGNDLRGPGHGRPACGSDRTRSRALRARLGPLSSASTRSGECPGEQLVAHAGVRWMPSESAARRAAEGRSGPRSGRRTRARSARL